MAKRRKKSEDSAEDEETGGEFTFDPGVQQELDLEARAQMKRQQFPDSRTPKHLACLSAVMSMS